MSDVGDITIALHSDFPPTGPPVVYNVINNVDLSNNIYYFILENIPYGSYEALTVQWHDPDDPNPSTNIHVIGSFGGSANNNLFDSDIIIINQS